MIESGSFNSKKKALNRSQLLFYKRGRMLQAIIINCMYTRKLKIKFLFVKPIFKTALYQFSFININNSLIFEYFSYDENLFKVYFLFILFLLLTNNKFWLNLNIIYKLRANTCAEYLCIVSYLSSTAFGLLD